jgi:NADH-quinone oxidoreductase subunit M
VVVAAALNGIAVLHAYFHLFTGASHPTAISLEARWPEWLAIAGLSICIIGGGLFPQAGVSNGYHAAVELIHRRSHVFEPDMSPDKTPQELPLHDHN